jgi:hypothetical protein
MAAQALNTNEGTRIVLTIKGPPQNTGAIPKTKSSTTSRQKRRRKKRRLWARVQPWSKGTWGLNP